MAHPQNTLSEREEGTLKQLLAAGACSEEERRSARDEGMDGLKLADVNTLVQRDLVSCRHDRHGRANILRFWLTPEGQHVATQIVTRRKAA